jgi:hypothetical protein
MYEHSYIYINFIKNKNNAFYNLGEARRPTLLERPPGRPDRMVMPKISDH